jgi:hypothetical protein
MRTDNGIDRAGITAMRAADTQRFIDKGDTACRDTVGYRLWVTAEQVSKPANRVVATRGAQIDCCLTGNDRRGIWPAAGITALGTLCLWQHGVDFIDECIRLSRQFSPRRTE